MGWKELFKLEPFRFCLAVGLQMIAAVGEVGVAYTLTLQFNAVKSRNLQLFLWYTLIQLVCYALVFLFYNVAAILWQKALQKYFHLVRQEITDHYFLDGQQHELGSVQNRLTNDIKILHNDYFNSFRWIAGMLASILSVAFTLLTFQWSLLIACLILATVQIFLPKLLDKPLQKATQKVSLANKEYLKILGDWLIGLSEIRRFEANEKLFKTVARFSGRLEAANVQKQKIDQELDYLNQLAYSLGDALIFLLTGFLVVNNLAAFGLVASIGNFSAALFGSLQGVANYTGRMRATKKLRAEIFASREKLTLIKDSDVKAPAGFAIHGLAIDFENGEGVAFPDIKVKAGEKILLTGDSGAGKSTLFKLLLGEKEATRGKIQYFDQNGALIKPDLAEIGYLPQVPTLFPVSIKENITMFNRKLLSGVNTAIKQVEFAADVAKMPAGIETKINLDQLNISGGQRQKIVLARSLVHQSKLILIDEATSAIDQAATMKILQKIIASDATVVFIAHNFNKEMRHLFDREIHL